MGGGGEPPPQHVGKLKKSNINKHNLQPVFNKIRDDNKKVISEAFLNYFCKYKQENKTKKGLNLC